MSRSNPRHGKYNGYAKDKCRCERCREANTAYTRSYRSKRRAEGLEDEDPRHGSTVAYQTWGCRCQRCRAAMALRRGPTVRFVDEESWRRWRQEILNRPAERAARQEERRIKRAFDHDLPDWQRGTERGRHDPISQALPIAWDDPVHDAVEHLEVGSEEYLRLARMAPVVPVEYLAAVQRGDVDWIAEHPRLILNADDETAPYFMAPVENEMRDAVPWDVEPVPMPSSGSLGGMHGRGKTKQHQKVMRPGGHRTSRKAKAAR